MFRRVSRCVRGWGLGWRVRPTRGYSARTGRALRRHKNGKYAAVTRGRPVFQRHEAHAEGNDTTPMQKCKNNTVCKKKNPLKASRRNISFLCYKWKISLLRILFPISAEFSFYGSLITSLGGGQHRICLVCGEAAVLPNALGGAWPHTPKLRAEAHTHF